MSINSSEPVEYESSVNIQSFMLFVFAVTVGLLVAVVFLPIWMPNMAFSIGGDSIRKRSGIFRAQLLLYRLVCCGFPWL